LFNHKGGVSKTTTTFHLGWMMAELGKKVLMVDSDPQCNLTGLCLNLSGNENFEEFYSKSGVDNLKSALAPVFEGNPIPLKPANCFEFPGRPNLYLLPGHIGFAEFEVSISIAQELTGSLRLAQNIPGAISHLLRLTANKYEFDYILIDMSPSVSATNSNLLMQSDYFLVPCSPDYYCNMAIDSLSNFLPKWYNTYESIRNHNSFKEALYQLPNSNPKFLGTIQQRFRPRNGGAVKSFRSWIDRINLNVNETLVPALMNFNMIIDREKFESIVANEKPYNLSNIPDFNGLIAQSQKHNVPVFSLTEEQIEQVGQVLTNSENNRDTFHGTFNRLADVVIKLTNS